MSFFPIEPCCLKGGILPGEPSGILEPASGGQRVARYHAKPSGGSVDKTKAVVLLYDVFGLKIVRPILPCQPASKRLSKSADDTCQPNAKLLADKFAEQLKLDVFVPDYIRMSLFMPHPPFLQTVEQATNVTFSKRSRNRIPRSCFGIVPR